MYYRYYRPYPYYRRYYNLNPYYYGRYYNPYYNYQQNIVDSQVSDIDQIINNFGDMTDVIQDADVIQVMTPKPRAEHKEHPDSHKDDIPNNVPIKIRPIDGVGETSSRLILP
jgi:hypothetical protein